MRGEKEYRYAIFFLYAYADAHADAKEITIGVMHRPCIKSERESRFIEEMNEKVI